MDETQANTALQMPRGSRYRGQLMDVSSRRSIELVTTAGRDATLETHETTLDFFFHAGQYWRAVVPADCVGQVLGQAFNFSRTRTQPGPDGPKVIFGKNGLPKRTVPCLNHVQSRFKCDETKPVRLYPLGMSTIGSPVYTVTRFAYSAEAVGPAGVRFNLIDAVLGGFVTAHRFVSMEELVFERIVVQGQYIVESPPLPISREAANELLRRSLLRSHRAAMSETYRLYHPCGTNNCTSSPLEILDDVVRYRGLARLGSFLYRLPLSPRFYLRVRGLYRKDDSSRLVRHEFQSYIESPATQQRKRDYVRTQVRAERAARAARQEKTT